MARREGDEEVGHRLVLSYTVETKLEYLKKSL
jgi:hypothetical protein